MEPMKPMQPMQPMRPMEPMKLMEPMRFERWWPEGLGEPSTSGGSNGLRYAFFPEARRLVIERGGARTTYDTGSHRIGGVSSQQQNGGEPSVSFTSQHGAVRLDELRRVDGQSGHGEVEHGERQSEPHGESADRQHDGHSDERRGAQHAHPHDERGPRAAPAPHQRPQERHEQERPDGRAHGERVVFSEEAGAGSVRLLLRGDFDIDMVEALEDFLRRQKRRLSRAD